HVVRHVRSLHDRGQAAHQEANLRADLLVVEVGRYRAAVRAAGEVLALDAVLAKLPLLGPERRGDPVEDPEQLLRAVLAEALLDEGPEDRLLGTPDDRVAADRREQRQR